MRARNTIYAGTLGAAAIGLGLVLGSIVPAQTAAAAPEPNAEVAPRPTLVDARDLLTRARAHYRAQDYELAMEALDRSIAICNELVLTSKSSSVRRATGNVFRACASLRLACSKYIHRLADPDHVMGPSKAEIFGEDGHGPAPTGSEHALVLQAYGMTPPAMDPDEEEMAWIDLLGGDHSEPRDFEFAPSPVEVQPATLPGITLVHNSLVQKWIDFYTGRGRKNFERYLERAAMYQDWMKEILREEGMPEDIIHLVYVESGFNNHAVSRSRAVGQWQFIYGTGRLFDLRINSWVDDRRDPELATRAAARYLKHLYSLYGDWELAMASYNCGEGRVIRTVARQGTKDYWKLRLPRETRNYVPKFMAVMTIARDPARYGFTIPEPNRLQFDVVRLPGAVDLKAIAANVGVSLDSLRSLNPAFRKFAAPPDQTGVSMVRVPAGSGETLIAGLTDGTVTLPRMIMPREPQYQRHRVRRGQTLGAIARRYGVSTRQLAQINKIRNIHRLRIGQVLMVPDRVGITYAPDTTPQALKQYAKTETSGDRTYSGTKTIRIARGDTLIGLAKRYGTDVSTLRALNELRPRQSIIAGAKLKVPVR